MNVVWQAVRYRQMGILPGYGDDYRGFFYDTLYATLYRAGFLSRATGGHLHYQSEMAGRKRGIWG